jgi:hypothetical protein
VADFRIGNHVWIPCDVKPGPFSDERFVKVSSSSGDWYGFVAANSLREPVVEGSTAATAVVVDVKKDRFRAQIIGEALSDTLLEDFIERAQTID